MAHLRCDSCADTRTLDGPAKLGEACSRCNVGFFRLAGPAPIGYIFEEGETAHLGTIQDGFFVRLMMPSGVHFDVRVDGAREELVITSPAKSGHVGVVFGRENTVHVGMIPQ